MSRRTVFVLSVLGSLLFHAVFLVLSPHMTLLAAHSDPPELLNLVRVDVEEYIPVAEPAPTPDPAQALGSVEELLARTAEQIAPIESLLEQAAEVPQLAERVASEEIERNHELERDEDLAQVLDTRIVEIASATAREEIEIPRRFVRASPNRVIDENVFPTIRQERDEGFDDLLNVDPLAKPQGLPADQMLERGQGGLDAEQAGPSVAASSPDVGSLPDLPIEQHTRQQVAKAIRDEGGYEFMDDLVNIEIDTFKRTDEKLGYFRLRIVPKKDQTVAVLPKDVTFVIDASKSIQQRKLELTAHALKENVRALRGEDRFNVVIFRDTSTSLFQQLTPATIESKEAAYRFLDSLESKGETDVYNGISSVLQTDARPGVPNIVVIATDGRSTTGVKDTREIINGLTQHNALQSSIFAYGGGRTVDGNLLDLLAYRNKGAAFVSPELDAIGKDLSSFVGRLNDPIMVDLNADYGRIDDEEVFPKVVPDFYKGRAVTVYGRYDPGKDSQFVMRLTGAAGQKQKEVVFKADLTKAQGGGDAIAREWAFSKAYALIGQMTEVGEAPELKAELDALQQDYGIRTSYAE